MKAREIIIACAACCLYLPQIYGQEVVHVSVYDEAREKAENKANEGYMLVFSEVRKSQQSALNYKRRLLIDNVFVTEFQREALNSDMHISQDIILLMEKNIQELRNRITEIWEYYDREFMGNPQIAPIIETYYNAKKKQILEDTELVDRKVNAFIKGKGVESTIASPRQRMEIIREVRKEYQQLSGLSLKQSNIFRTLIIGRMQEQEKGGQP